MLFVLIFEFKEYRLPCLVVFSINLDALLPITIDHDFWEFGKKHFFLSELFKASFRTEVT